MDFYKHFNDGHYQTFFAPDLKYYREVLSHLSHQGNLSWIHQIKLQTKAKYSGLGCSNQDNRPGGGGGRDRGHPAGDHGPQPVRQSLCHKILWVIFKGNHGSPYVTKYVGSYLKVINSL